MSDRRARNQERPVGDTPEHSWVSLKSSLSSGPFIMWNLPSLFQDSLDNAKWMLFLTTEGLVQTAPGEAVSPSLQWWEPRLIGLGCRKGLERWFSPGGGHVGIPWEGEVFSPSFHAIPEGNQPAIRQDLWCLHLKSYCWCGTSVSKLPFF